MFGPSKRTQGANGRIRVGEPQTSPTAPAHAAGVKQGNARGNLKREKGLGGANGGEAVKASARRSTGINPRARDPIDARMPNLPPA